MCSKSQCIKHTVQLQCPAAQTYANITEPWKHGDNTCMLYKIMYPKSSGSLTCVSVSISEVATSKRLGLERYLLSLNWFSNSSSCWLVNAVLGLRHFPNKPAWAVRGEEKGRYTLFSSLSSVSNEEGILIYFLMIL